VGKLIIAVVAFSWAVYGRTQEAQQSEAQKFDPAPPALALAETDQQALVREAFAILDDPEASLEQRLESLRKWCLQKRFFYAHLSGYHLLVSADVLIAENPSWARLEVLRLLNKTLVTGKPLEIHRLPRATQAAMVATIERGELAVFSGFAQMFRGEAYMVLGARLVAEWTTPDGVVRRSEFAAPLHSLEDLLRKPPAHIPSLKVEAPPYAKTYMYNAPAAPTAFTRGMQAMSQFWENLNRFAAEEYRKLYDRIVEEIARKIEERIGAKGVIGATISWEHLPIQYQTQLLENLRRNRVEPPATLQLRVRPAVYAYQRLQHGALHQITWGLDEQVVPITFGIISR